MRSCYTALIRTLFSIKPLSNELNLRFYSTIDAPNKDASFVFKDWGFTEAEILRIFARRPSLCNADLPNLESKLGLLRKLGLNPSDLANIIHRRPRFLSYNLNRYFDQRLDFLESFFGSRELLIKAIIRNPSLLTNDYQKNVAHVVEMYAGLGIGKCELVSLLMSHPTLILRSKLCEEKVAFIRKTGLSRESKLYKYVVAAMARSRVETIREKLQHFQGFGFSEDEILVAVGRSPFLLMLSTDKIQRNMTFVVGIIKLPARASLDYPFLLYYNLETALKPRIRLACKIDEMGLVPRIQGPSVLTALRMVETQFIKAFISCHPSDVSEELMEFYRNAKGIKRLAVSSKKSISKGFPF